MYDKQDDGKNDKPGMWRQKGLITCVKEVERWTQQKRE